MGRKARWWINEKGEVCVWAPGHPEATRKGYVLEHRLVMERELGRPLERWETVRHKDGNRQNNDPANLVAVKSGAVYGARPKAGGWRDTEDNVGGVVRQILAVGKRIAKSDPESLELLRDIQGVVDQAWTTALLGLSAQGFSDGEIARALGISQQAVSKRRKRMQEDESNGEGRARGRGA